MRDGLLIIRSNLESDIDVESLLFELLTIPLCHHLFQTILHRIYNSEVYDFGLIKNFIKQDPNLFPNNILEHKLGVSAWICKSPKSKILSKYAIKENTDYITVLDRKALLIIRDTVMGNPFKYLWKSHNPQEYDFFDCEKSINAFIKSHL